MEKLIEIVENEAKVSHRVVAQYTDKKEEAISRIINKYKKEFEEFGLLGFKIRAIKNGKNKVNNFKTYYLNEDQVNFLITLLRNSTVAIEFKKRLVKEFSALRNESELLDKIKMLEDIIQAQNKLIANNQKQLPPPTDIQKIVLDMKKHAKVVSDNLYRDFCGHLNVVYLQNEKKTP